MGRESVWNKLICSNGGNISLCCVVCFPMFYCKVLTKTEPIKHFQSEIDSENFSFHVTGKNEAKYFNIPELTVTKNTIWTGFIFGTNHSTLSSPERVTFQICSVQIDARISPGTLKILFSRKIRCHAVKFINICSGSSAPPPCACMLPDEPDDHQIKCWLSH